MVITTTAGQAVNNGSIAIEPSFDSVSHQVDSLGDDNLPDLAPTKKRRRGRPKQENIIRRMDIVMKKPDSINKTKAKRRTVKPVAKVNTGFKPEPEYKKPETVVDQETPERELQTVKIRSGILLDSPVRPQNEISTHATAAAKSYLPESPLVGFNAFNDNTDFKISLNNGSTGILM